MERSQHYGLTGTSHLFGMTRETPARCANQLSLRPAALCRRLLCASRPRRTCPIGKRGGFPQERARSREPAAASSRAQIPARPGTGGTETTQAMGRVAAEMCTATGASTPAELPRQTAAIHHFQTHAARSAAFWPQNSVERSDERLNPLSLSAIAGGHCGTFLGLA